MNAQFKGYVHMVRMSPAPRSVLGNPSAGQTFLCGKGIPNEKVYLHCNVKYCQILFRKVLADGRALFESSNFLDAGTGRTLLLSDDAGNHELISTMIDSKYPPNRYFLSEQPLCRIKADSSITAEPVITARTDENGRFLAAAEELQDGVCKLLGADGSVQKEYPFRAGGRFMMD